MRSFENPGRPYYTRDSGRLTASAPYVPWTPDYHPWMQDALCDPLAADDVWFGETKAARDFAVAICQECPVRRECLERTLKQEEALDRHTKLFGVSGGLTAEQRTKLRAKANQAAA